MRQGLRSYESGVQTSRTMWRDANAMLYLPEVEAGSVVQDTGTGIPGKRLRNCFPGVNTTNITRWRTERFTWTCVELDDTKPCFTC
jgi:hypothetical protein